MACDRGRCSAVGRRWASHPLPHLSPFAVMPLEPQPEIVKQFAESFEACEVLDAFSREHRPVGHGGMPVLTWTLARSARTFIVVVHLCRLGYGQQASMLNRTLFEDMVYAHWAARYPARSQKLMRWHEGYVKLRRIAVYKRHKLSHSMTPPEWDGKRRDRMGRLFRSGGWTGRSIPKMVNRVEAMWGTEEERQRLHRIHDLIHQSYNAMMHHSSRSLSIGVEVADDGATTFNLKPSTDLVGLALGFAFWTYANTISLTLEGDNLTALNELATRYDHVVPDRTLLKLMHDTNDEEQLERD